MSWFRKRLKDLRQEKVAYWRARGLGQTAIIEKLSLPIDEGGLRNPETGAPYSSGVIAEDFLELDRKWQTEASRSTGEMKARLLSEFEQAKAAAWELGGDKGIKLVVQILAREALLFGLQEIQVRQYNLNVDIAALDETQLARLAAGEDPAQVLGQPAQVVEGESRVISSGETSACLESGIHEEKFADEEAGLGEGRLGEEGESG